MNRRVYISAAFLVLVSVVLITAKVIYGGQSVQAESSRNLWRINIVFNVKGQGERAKVRLTLPKDTERQTIYNEHFESDELVFYVRERKLTGNRIGFWRSELLDGSRSVQYTFSAQLKGLNYVMPANLFFPDKPAHYYSSEFQAWLDPSAFIQSQDVLVKRSLKRIVKRERNIPIVTRRIYDFVRGEVKYQSEKGSKDARATLDQLVADCGGQARLFAAMSRAAGIPSRVVGGLILSGGVKNTTHVWVENYIGGRWVPFDAVNGHFASIPDHYLELYRGDYYLFKHTGLAKFEYFFVIGRERIPPVDNPWSLYVLPIHFQNLIKVLLLIPVGALVVAFFRTVVGVPTFGTFAPILLALAFREISFWVGLFCLLVIIFCGWVLRKVLDALKILVIPRLSIIVTMVVMFIMAMMVIGFHLGEQKILFISLFPMIIMTWTIERFSVIQVEDGTPAALISALGTLLVAAVAYWIMGFPMLRAYLFAFPELLFVLMAALLILGRYTGIRLTELYRFREFSKVKDEVKEL